MIEAVRKVPGGGRRKAETRFQLGARCSVRAETRAIDYLSYYISSFLGPSLSHAVSQSPAGFGHPSLDLDSSRVTGGQSGDIVIDLVPALLLLDLGGRDDNDTMTYIRSTTVTQTTTQWNISGRSDLQ